MKLYNTLTRQIEEFKPLNPLKIGMYTCGPTVYDRMHIGNLRTFLLSDLLERILLYKGLEIKTVQNITDIDDKIIKRAHETNSSIQQVAEKFTKMFFEDIEKLNIQSPDKQPKATEYVEKMIAYIKNLIDGGFAYIEKDGSVYFDISKFSNYGKLSQLDMQELKTGTRVLSDEYTKDNVQDFALWKSTPDEEFSFDSPWGKGRPGWHIECSVMSQELLGDTFDIHVGGIDLMFPHHENEIAQSEAKTGKKFVNYFIHGEHILVDGKKMSKSLNNFYTLDDLAEKNIEPLALRYLYLQTHYRKQMNFTWESVSAAQKALNNLRENITALRSQTERTDLSEEKLGKIDEYRARFNEAIANDLQMPQAIAVLWEVLKSNIPSTDKLDLVLDFDQVLGLKLSEVEDVEIPEEIKQLAEEREGARKNNDFAKSDDLRKQISEKGYTVEDTPEGFKIKKYEQ